MGASGVAVFADDLASDVRGDWREAIVDGATPEEATEKLEAAYAGSISDADDSVVFWLALAAAQMETGRLLEGVRDRAVAIIDAGGDVARWQDEDESLARQRARVLERLRAKLTGPQPAPKRIRPPRILSVPFDLGDVVLVRNDEDGARALAAVVDHHEGRTRSERHPVVELLLWDDDSIPSPGELARLPSVQTEDVDDITARIHGARIRPHLHVVTTYRRDDVFGPHIGEVVARGVEREPSADFRRGALDARAPCVATYTSWRNLVEDIGGELFRREVEATRAALAAGSSPPET